MKDHKGLRGRLSREIRRRLEYALRRLDLKFLGAMAALLLAVFVVLRLY